MAFVHGGSVPGCVLRENLGFNPILYLFCVRDTWFVVVQRSAVITILIVPFLLWLMFTCGTLPFFYFPNCHSAHGRELFPASQPFRVEIAPFLLPTIFCARIKFVLFFFFFPL